MDQSTQLPPGEYVIPYGSRNVTLFGGWMSSPNQRGTIDILWSCVLTILLSSWSVLCLNLPAEDDGFWRRLRRKSHWTWLSVMGPEVIFQLSLGEWLAARRSYKAFQKLGHHGWSMTHSFYANMGGILLHTPDYGSFPINAEQLYYLVTKSFVTYPAISRNAIQDKNKADVIVRALTLVQVLWFLLQCIGRAFQGLAITTLELSTIAFISSATGTSICWYQKPMDIETPDVIYLDISVAAIQAKAGYEDYTWISTPLDFIDRRSEWPWNIYWRWGLAVMSKKLGMSALIMTPKKLPVERVRDDYWPEPTFKSLPVLMLFHGAYVSILMADWNLDLPSYTELILWRVASCIQLGTIVSGWLIMPLQLKDTPPRLQRVFGFVTERWQRLRERRLARHDFQEKPRWYNKYALTRKTSGTLGQLRHLTNDDPEWAVSLRLLVVYEITWVVYLLARAYVVVEEFASLRAVPPSAFQTVNWGMWLPHI